jgi:hypothetical protein
LLSIRIPLKERIRQGSFYAEFGGLVKSSGWCLFQDSPICLQSTSALTMIICVSCYPGGFPHLLHHIPCSTHTSTLRI